MTEKIVTRRSSLTAYERALNLKNSRPPPLTPGGRAEIKLTQLYRDPRNFPAPRPVNPLPIPVRPPRPPNPNPYNKGPVPTPQPIRVPYRNVGESRIPWSMRENLRWHTRQLSRRLGLLHPWLRALNFALDAYDLWRFRQEFIRGFEPGGWYVSNGYEIVERCNGGPGPLRASNTWVACFPYYSDVSEHPEGARFWQFHNVDYTDTFFGSPKHYPLIRLYRTDQAEVTPPQVGWREATARLAATATPQPKLVIPVPYRNRFNDALRHPETMQPDMPRQPPRRPIVTGGHRWSPAPPRTKEQKFKLSGPLAALMKAAWTATEAIDLIDVFWESLPEDIRKTTPKTAKTYGNARVGKGVPYSDPVDKALHVWKNWDKINWAAFLKNFAANQIEDYIVGSISGNVAAFLKKNGVTVTGLNLHR